MSEAAIRCPVCGPKPGGGVYCSDCGEVLYHGTNPPCSYESDTVIWEFGSEMPEAARQGGRRGAINNHLRAKYIDIKRAIRLHGMRDA